MIKSSIEKLAGDIGYDVGASNDITQSDLLNGLCRGLTSSIRTKGNLEMQLCYIAKHLNGNTENVLIELVEFLKLKNK